MKLIAFLACIVLMYKVSEAYHLPFIRKLSLYGTGWTGTCATGIRQSPVDISSNRAKYDYFLREIFITSTNTAEEWKVKNTGDGIALEPIGKKFSFVAMPEREEFELEEIVLRWRGSEHLINGERYAAELQLIHHSKASPVKKAIISFLLRETNRDNIRLESILAAVNTVKNDGETDSTSIVLNQIIPTRLRKYYRYSGSLTIQPCSESVEWYIIDDPILTISTKQLLALQEVKSSTGEPILTNSRPIQALNGRVVRKSFNGYSNSNPNYSPYSYKRGSSQNGYDSYGKNLYSDQSNSKYSKMNQYFGPDRYFDQPYKTKPAYGPYQSPSYRYSSPDQYGYQASPSSYGYPSDSYRYSSDPNGYPFDSYGYSSDSYDYSSPSYRYSSPDQYGYQASPSPYGYPSDSYRYSSDPNGYPFDSYGYSSDSYDYSSPSYGYPSDPYRYPFDSYGYGPNGYSNEAYDYNPYFSARPNMYKSKYDYQNDYKQDYVSSKSLSELASYTSDPAKNSDSFYHDYFNNNYKSSY